MDEVHYPGKERRTFHYSRHPVKGSVIIDIMIRAELAAHFAKKYESWTPRQLMHALNECITAFQMSERLPLGQADELCGARMVIAKDCGNRFSIAYVGDCFAVWETSTALQMTNNQAYRYDALMHSLIEDHWNDAARHLRFNPAKIQQGSAEWNTLRLEMWRRFGPQLSNARRVHINNTQSAVGHGVLNGQEGVERFIAEFDVPEKGLRYILLGNNGCTPWDMESGASRPYIATLLAAAIDNADDPERGLDNVIAQARQYERKTKISHAKGGRADAACALIVP
ncbi:hypothetical protein HY622_02210 [Candidatus Uhrbacteria bacterium]|nr:hypothetical protein [Candidatus Uhrbacteria bacterium]